MRTVKRNVGEVIKSSDIKNYSKYLNQMTFMGLQEGTDIYTLNQQSFADLDNVYVDDKSLVSRDPLQEKVLPDGVVPTGYTLIEIVTFEDIPIYVSKYDKDNAQVPIEVLDAIIKIVVEGAPVLDLATENYKLATVSHYIICFNDKGAKVLDINDKSEWKNLSDLAEIPISDTTTGNVTTNTGNTNDFTNKYKKQYIWSNSSHPVLPKDETGEVVLNTENDKIDLTVPNTSNFTEYRICKTLNYNEQKGYLLVNKDAMIVAYAQYAYLSYNLETFEKIYYPSSIGQIANIFGLTDDGHFFVVCTSGVYRYNLSDKVWILISVKDDNGTTKSIIKGYDFGYQIAHFLSSDVFVFVTLTAETPTEMGFNIYYMSPELKTKDEQYGHIKVMNIANDGWSLTGDATDYYKISLLTAYPLTDKLSKNCSRHLAKISYDRNNDTSNFLILLYNGQSNDNPNFNTFIGLYLAENTLTSKKELFYTEFTRQRLGSLSPLASLKNLVISDLELNDGKLTIILNMYLRFGNSVPYSWSLMLGDLAKNASTINMWSYQGEYGPAGIHNVTGLSDFYPEKIGDVFLTGNVFATSSNTLTSSNSKKRAIPIEIITSLDDINDIIINGDYWYIYKTDNTICTNKFSDDDFAVITYTYTDTTKPNNYEKVPSLVYSDTEMYLVYDNILQITQNSYEGTDIKFNLPTINDQSFISNINAMLNISQNEVALFFKGKVIICTKVEDSNFGFRYDYYPSRLSVGVRLGDSVLNTLEGQYTVLPTRRGLAFMSYQQFVATTDQTLTYVSDNIKQRWTNFYDSSQKIEILQWREYLVLQNGSNNLLLLNLENNVMSWWSWTLPVKVKQLFTDQVALEVLSDNLFQFKSSDRYFDFPKTSNQKPINWLIMSQPLHMNAPNYYKSIRQLIFQFIETSSFKSSILAQIKLYRKKVTIREAEAIGFKVDEFSTFVKRFNYWKINELQWGLTNDIETVTPAQLKLNGITIKYEIGSEVK